MTPLEWEPIDLRSDPDDADYTGDPADLLVDIVDLIHRPAWHRYAACRGQGAAFFPERGESTDAAKAICGTCPVTAPCLEAGLYDLHGIWGGLSGRQRRQERRAA